MTWRQDGCSLQGEGEEAVEKERCPGMSPPEPRGLSVGTSSWCLLTGSPLSLPSPRQCPGSRKHSVYHQEFFIWPQGNHAEYLAQSPASKMLGECLLSDFGRNSAVTKKQLSAREACGSE